MLRMNEQYKYEVIKKLVDTNSNKKAAALKLNCTLKTINRLIKLYKNEGKSGFIHKNRGRRPACAFNEDIKNKIVNLYINEYQDANLTHFCEIVKNDLGISVSDNTINKWLRQQYILSPKARRKTKKHMKKTLKSLKHNSKSKKIKNKFTQVIEQIDESEAHPRRPRCKYAGEMIQMDASRYEWIHNQIWHLHVAIDDATNEVVGAFFDYQETLNGYYNVFFQILNKYGIPAMFYTDKRTVFEFKRKDSLFDNEDTFTQFAYAAHQLGVEIKTTSVAQAKGRVERLNQTLQSRLPVELRRANINTIEQANIFLSQYVKEFNNQFALLLNNTKSVYEDQPDIEKINHTLAILNNRIIDSGHTIKYKKNYYIPINKNRMHQYFSNKTKCMVIETFDKNLFVNIGDEIYALEKIESREQLSKEFDNEFHTQRKGKAHVPPMSHPWKQKSFNRYLKKQKHREDSSVNV